MGDTKVVDARGLACPQPVVLTKQALEINEKVKVLVDNETALENIKRLGTKLGCAIKVETKKDSTFEIKLKRKKGVVVSSCSAATAASGPFVIVISANTMGQGNDELGSVLIRSFLHTVAEQPQKPDTIIFYNTGVKLTAEGSEVLDDLKQLESAGVQLLVCGTCLNYFEIKDKLAVGTVSNMYDILDTMNRAGRLLKP